MLFVRSFHYLLAAVLLFALWPLAAADAPGTLGRQELFNLSEQRTKLVLERELIDKRLMAINKRLAELEKLEVAGFDCVGDP